MSRVLKGSQFYLHTPRSSDNGMNHNCLCLPGRNWYSFTDPGGMDGWVGRREIERYTGIAVCLWRCIIVGHFLLPPIPSLGSRAMSEAWIHGLVLQCSTSWILMQTLRPSFVWHKTDSENLAPCMDTNIARHSYIVPWTSVLTHLQRSMIVLISLHVLLFMTTRNENHMTEVRQTRTHWDQCSRLQRILYRLGLSMHTAVHSYISC